ncbi:MAG: TIGR04076 family protein [Candidatus Thorarchaeota archaeon]
MTNHECIRNQPWDIVCRVVKQDGHCAIGHKVGDQVRFTGDEVQGRLCISAMYSMLPKVYAMMYNARFPWLKDQFTAHHVCPDGFNPVMFELVRKEPED